VPICPLKVRNRPDLLAWKWRATYHWKALNEGCNVVLDFTSIEDLHKKLWAPKVMRVLILKISKLPRQNDIWVQPPWLSIDNTIRGKMVASPKFGSWWVLWIHVCPWLIHAPKML
jgi:hypothetical protein